MNTFNYFSVADCVGDITLKGQLTKKNGGTYLYFYNIDVKVDVNKIKVQLEGLFGNDKALGMFRCKISSYFIETYDIMLFV